MNFNSHEFLVFFPAVFVLHWIMPHQFRWIVLLGASWLFYFWWDPWTGSLLVLTTLISWLCSLLISRTKNNRYRRGALILALTVCLGCLGIFKYTGFFASLIGMDLSLQIILPVGISFYTFQTLSYVLDVYRGTIEAERHFGYYALFVSFFPQLVAGPIERPENLLPQLRRPRKLTKSGMVSGGWSMLLGYFKKVVIADGLAPLVDQVYGAPGTALGPEIFLATLLFGMQIYCDFSGYSDIARGAAKWLGIDLMENFHSPYAAQSVREFWRRWHISLTSWFTDYVYIPLGGSRKGLARKMMNVMIVFLLSGLWHGADWTFILWGGIHGVYQITGILLDRYAQIRLPNRPATTVFRQFRTFLLVNFAWLFFRAETMADAVLLLGRLSSGWLSGFSLSIAAPGIILQVVLLLLCLYAIERLPARKGSSLTQSALAFFCTATAIMLGWLILLSTNSQNAFIYFQF